MKENRQVIAKVWGGERRVNAKEHKEIWGVNKIVHILIVEVLHDCIHTFVKTNLT